MHKFGTCNGAAIKSTNKSIDENDNSNTDSKSRKNITCSHNATENDGYVHPSNK